MRYKSFRPGTLLSPVPAVLVSCAGEDGRPNALTVAWAGTVCSDPPMVSVSIRPERYSHGLITQTGEFVINLLSEEMLPDADYCGVRSGRDGDKLALRGLKCVPAEGLEKAPAIDGAPMHLSCRVERVIPLGSHDLFIARIVAMRVREDLVDESGGIRLERARLTAYSHGVYYSLGKALGFFGYSVASPRVLSRRMKDLRQAAKAAPSGKPKRE